MVNVVPQWVKRLNRIESVKPKVRPAERRFLLDFFRDDIRRLEPLIGRNLSSWLRG